MSSSIVAYQRVYDRNERVLSKLNPEKIFCEFDDYSTKFPEAAIKVDITSEEKMKLAIALLHEIRSYIVDVENRKKTFTKGTQDYVQRVQKAARGVLTPLKNAERSVRVKISQYQEKIIQEQTLARKEAEKELENSKLTSSVKKRKLDEVAPPLSNVIKGSEGAKVHQRTVWDFQVSDPNLVPNKFLKIDEAVVRKAIQDGERKIPGINIFSKKITVITDRP